MVTVQNVRKIYQIPVYTVLEIGVLTLEGSSLDQTVPESFVCKTCQKIQIFQCYQKIQINTLKYSDPTSIVKLQCIHALTSESLDQLRDFMGCLGRGILENFCELPPPIEGGGGAPENKPLHVIIKSSSL